MTLVLGDFHSFDIDGSAGELMRFYGNRCLHYTTENTTDTCRVSFDFRVIPASLFRLNMPSTISSEVPCSSSDGDGTEESQQERKTFLDDESLKKLAVRGAKPLLEGKYYQRMMVES